jgi:hypothetical protein
MHALPLHPASTLLTDRDALRVHQVEFLLNGSSPVKCDAELKHALPATLIQCAYGFIAQPFLVVAIWFLGCNSTLADFPNEDTQR